MLGEKWALLAIREIALGNRRFDEIARNTGAPRDRLASRLRSLEEAGLVERQQYSERPPRFEYALTEAGLALRPMLQVLRSWGDRWAVEEVPSRFTHTCGNAFEPVVTCASCGEPMTGDDLRVEVLSPGWSRKGAVPS